MSHVLTSGFLPLRSTIRFVSGQETTTHWEPVAVLDEVRRAARNGDWATIPVASRIINGRQYVLDITFEPRQFESVLEYVQEAENVMGLR